MAAVEKISIALTPELAAVVREAVAGGQYASASEVIREALRIWKSEQTEKAVAVAKLHQLWQEGIDSGPGAPLDVEAIKRRGRARLAARRAKAG